MILLAKALANLQEGKALEIAREMIASGDDPLHIVEVDRKGMDEVGLRYERNEYYLRGLIMSGEIFNEIIALLDYEPPVLDPGDRNSKVVMGAPLGDVHDIGKNIVVTVLRCDGYRVHDLGADVAPAAGSPRPPHTGLRLCEGNGGVPGGGGTARQGQGYHRRRTGQRKGPGVRRCRCLWR